MKFIILCEDQGKNSTYLLGESSLSILIESGGQNILFDTGGHTLQHNAALMNVDLSNVNQVVLSHSHWDHSEGLRELAKHTGRIRLTLHPECFRESYVLYQEYPRHVAFQPDRLRKMTVDGQDYNAKYVGLPFNSQDMQKLFDVNLSAAPTIIAPGITFLGSIPRLNGFEAKNRFTYELEDGKWKESEILDDSGLAINTNRGLIVVSGCGHAGIANTIEYAKKVCETDRTFAVFGGFHLLNAEERVLDQTVEYLKNQKLEVVYPCHCVDATALSRFVVEFGCEKVCAGDIVDWSLYGIELLP